MSCLHCFLVSRSMEYFDNNFLPLHLIRFYISILQSLQLYTSAEIVPSAIGYHVSLMQNTLKSCWKQKQLHNEFFCQLIKQTTNINSEDSPYITTQVFNLRISLINYIYIYMAVDLRVHEYIQWLIFKIKALGG